MVVPIVDRFALKRQRRYARLRCRLDSCAVREGAAFASPRCKLTSRQKWWRLLFCHNVLMAFKKRANSAHMVDSPEKLLRDLPRRKIPDVLPHQAEIMRSYVRHALTAKDVAMQLPTGSGKTLVGLLIGEWLRRRGQERVVYLCPTKQLVNQVVEQSQDKYGLSVVGFTGAIKSYSPSARSAYNNADQIAITTYNSLFNTNPFFSNADVVIVDDSHTAEQYIASMWSLKITKATHETLHTAISLLLKPHIETLAYSRITGEWTGEKTWVDKIPTPTLASIHDDLREVLEEHLSEDSDLKHVWKCISDNLSACHLYLSSKEFLIRPLIPPTWTHAPFSNPRQRIFMSANLGRGGDLERLTGRKNVQRLAPPEGWDRQAVGRRYFMFPEMSLQKKDVEELRRELMARAGRSVVLVPNDKLEDEVRIDVKNKLKFPTFSADDIEKSKATFVAERNAVAVIANRYDGIDFPGEECRLLFIEGLPKAVNLQERFLMSRMGAHLLFNERIQTRVLQAVGRCTRSLEDQSAVVVSGEDLPDYLSDVRRRKYLHPDLQAELRFGIEPSKEVKAIDLIENFGIFQQNGQEWEDANGVILSYRDQCTQDPFPGMSELLAVVNDEVEFQAYMWQRDYEEAVAAAGRVLGKILLPELKGYRALWHYLAGSAALLASENDPAFKEKATDHFSAAKKAAPGIPWLVRLSKFQTQPDAEPLDNNSITEQLEKVELILEKFGTLHDRAFSAKEKLILEGLNSKEKGPFEEAHRALGEILGFETGNVETDGSPDPWWLSGNKCLVFEDHQGADADSAVDVSKARQAASHPNWIRKNVALARDAEIKPVLVTPARSIKLGAVPHVENLALWKLGDFKDWAKNALSVLRQLRTSFMEPGNLIWRANAATAFEKNSLDINTLFTWLATTSAEKDLKVVN